MENPSPRCELLIVSPTPQNLERGDLWFSENFDAIKKAIGIHAWWRENAMIIETNLEIKPSLFMRRLTELGYERSSTIPGKGLFAARGGVIEIWPVNQPAPWLVEFIGNAIATITPREKIKETVQPRVHSKDALEKLTPGALVVHIDHGIGIWRGRQEEYFVVEYAPPSPGGTPDRLLVPKDQKDRLTPYVGFETPRIHRLGSTIWLRTRKKIGQDAEKFARELLALYARRHQAERAPYEPDQGLMEHMRSSFPFRETEDQLRSEEEIMSDLTRSKPMDRILAGDVGFGKTEVALRAALAAITSGKQVALLAPTTVLAAQHQKTFAARLTGLPVNIRMLSRLTMPKEKNCIAEEMRGGLADCVIGTHRLLSSDVQFKNLGLVIIDEEQRFGVKQKERFKELRSETDILSLSATPIPRTLSLALAHLRDISTLSTPPPERVPIKTAVLPYATYTIREAIQFELARGGQVYFLHNRIETIGAAKEKLLKILKPRKKSVSLPFLDGRREIVVTARDEPRIGILHGRMGEKELIRVMDQFRNRELDILLATTIIENGLDISSANTLIVDDAVRLGLAQAHQLRGRIGRGGEQAFAYFLYRPRRLTDTAGERLSALQEYADLGAGYEIALRDLEIRGAGNILGREQSGAINKVGLNLYCQVLGDAVEEIRQEKNPA